MHLNGKVTASDHVVLVPQSSILRPLLVISYTFKFFHIVENQIVGYAHGITIYAVIPRPISYPQVMKSVN